MLPGFKIGTFTPKAHILNLCRYTPIFKVLSLCSYVHCSHGKILMFYSIHNLLCGFVFICNGFRIVELHFRILNWFSSAQKGNQCILNKFSPISYK